MFFSSIISTKIIPSLLYRLHALFYKTLFSEKSALSIDIRCVINTLITVTDCEKVKSILKVGINNFPLEIWSTSLAYVESQVLTASPLSDEDKSETEERFRKNVKVGIVSCFVNESKNYLWSLEDNEKIEWYRQWLKQENEAFLRHTLEGRQVASYFDAGMYTDALQLASKLLKELKALDDKLLWLTVQILESKIYHALDDLPRARASLESARTVANIICCWQKIKAALDLQSGILHAADEDCRTAYSYFSKAFLRYNNEKCDDSMRQCKALIALKYMLLCKIMLGLADEVNQIVSEKLTITYSGRDIDAMKMVAQAVHKRSLVDFEQALKVYHKELQEDPIIKAHFMTSQFYLNFA